jgi:hypothetical protein
MRAAALLAILSAAPAPAQPDPGQVRTDVLAAAAACVDTLPEGRSALAALTAAVPGNATVEDWYDGTRRAALAAAAGSPVIELADAEGAKATCYIATGYLGAAEALPLVEALLAERHPGAFAPADTDLGCAALAGNGPGGPLVLTFTADTPEGECLDDGSVLIRITQP